MPVSLSSSAARTYERVTSSRQSAAVSALAELGVADVMSETPSEVAQLFDRGHGPAGLVEAGPIPAPSG